MSNFYVCRIEAWDKVFKKVKSVTTRHALSACTDVNEPPLPKRSKWKHHTPPTRYRRRSHRTTRSTSLLRHFVNGTARCCSRALVDHQDTRIERSYPVQVRLQINYTRHDYSRGSFEDHVPGTDPLFQH